MEKKTPEISVTLVGSGNVGTHLGHALVESGIRIVQVAGRTHDSTMALARALNCSWTTDIENIRTDVDLILLAVNDRSIEDVVRMMKPGNTLVVHTAGAVSMSVFTGYVKNYGVLYPLQTFSKTLMPDLKGVPFCIEANSPVYEQFLYDLVCLFKAVPVKISSEKRAFLHISAVFANNFVNHMYVHAEMILGHAGLPFSLLSPIIKETVSRAIDIGPGSAQTGPAVRNEENVIKKHLELLSFSPETAQLYAAITESIRQISNR